MDTKKLTTPQLDKEISWRREWISGALSIEPELPEIREELIKFLEERVRRENIIISTLKDKIKSLEEK